MNNDRDDNRDRYLYGDDEKVPEPTPKLMGKKKFGSAKVISTVLISVALVLLGIIISLVSNGYVIKNTIINGESPYTEEEINTLLSAYFEERGSKSYFYINTEELTEMIKQEMPYIKTLTVKKKAPDTIILEVEGETAESYIEYLGSYYLLNADMKVLERTEQRPLRTKLIELDMEIPAEIKVGSVIVFAQDSRMDAESYARIYTALDSSGIRDLTAYLDVRNKFDISLRMHSGTDVKIGSVKDIEEKLSTLAKWIEENPDEMRSTLNIDVSVLKKIYISYD